MEAHVREVGDRRLELEVGPVKEAVCDLVDYLGPGQTDVVLGLDHLRGARVQPQLDGHTRVARQGALVHAVRLPEVDLVGRFRQEVPGSAPNALGLVW